MANIVTLQDVKAHLRYPADQVAGSSPDDIGLQKFINAADECIEFECDDILPHRHTELHDGGLEVIHLRHVPLLSVQNVEEGWGYISFELDYQEVNSPPPGFFSMYAYSIDSYENAQISRRSAGNIVIPFRTGMSNIKVDYTSGEEAVPAVVQLAELELIAHWWQNSQLRAASLAGSNLSYDAVQGAVYTRDTESGTQNMNIGVPYRILEMLKSRRHRPIIA